ncbi:hypothetical protein FRX31_012965 [Thalictrum thalictroides]|uniref:Transmembrane protein n=1 Tax=Thalictrum thalictroides TaxID=46969 RepID=A0A7J6WJA2_THATH|nr:hypothetical protein FRX31_012965 [Thalictrum thalictroides]
MKSSRSLLAIFIAFLLLVGFYDQTTSSVLADTMNFKIVGRAGSRPRKGGRVPPTPSSNPTVYYSPPPAPWFGN